MLNLIPQIIVLIAGALFARDILRIWKTRTKLNPWIKGNGTSDSEKWFFSWRRDVRSK